MRLPRPAVLLAALAALVGLVALLTAAPPGVTLRADARAAAPLELERGEQCTGLRVLPDETKAVRLTIAEGERAPARVVLRAEGVGELTSGPAVRRGANAEYRLPRAVEGDHAPAQVCLQVQPGGATVLGEGIPAITLLGASRSNWISALPLLIERASFGRGTVLGTLALPLALLALLAGWIISVRLASTTMRQPGPVGRRAVVKVAAVAALFGSAFAVTTPPIQAPDEMVHLHYAELLVDKGHIPVSNVPRQGFSPQLQQVLWGAAVGNVAFSPDRRPPWTRLEDEQLDASLKALPSGGSRDAHTNASSQPPGYYALLAVAQKVTGGSLLDRLLIDRLLSALLFALGIAGAVVFAREAVPRAGGLVVAGGLLLAWLPITGFIGGSVNPDAALVATSAWTLALTAMILRRGLTVRRALALGALVGLGVLAKLTFIGLLPAVLLAAIVVGVRGVRGGQARTTVVAIAGALAVAALIAVPYLAWAQLSGRGITFGPPGGAPGPVISLRENLVYTFELFAGSVGPVADRIPGSGPIDIWAVGLAGKLGWLDYGFARNTVLGIALFWGLLAAGAVWGVVRAGVARRSVPIDAVVYAVAALGLMVLIARSGLISRLQGSTGFEQARYLFPIAALGVGGVALALRQLPRPAWREWAGAIVVVFALVHGTAAFFLTVGRYFA